MRFMYCTGDREPLDVSTLARRYSIPTPLSLKKRGSCTHSCTTPQPRNQHHAHRAKGTPWLFPLRVIRTPIVR